MRILVSHGMVLIVKVTQQQLRWRRGSESNRRIKVLQTSPLPLGYRALLSKVALTAKKVHDPAAVTKQATEQTGGSKIPLMFRLDLPFKTVRLNLGTGILILTALLLSSACQSKRDSTAAPSVAPPVSNNEPAKSQPSVEKSLPESWLGKWDGPEGTFLRVSKSGEKYQITIQNLDGPRTFDAAPMGDRLGFTRDGQSETIHAGNGEDAGMKWLLDKKNCLVIRKGEGFCRD